MKSLEFLLKRIKDHTCKSVLEALLHQPLAFQDTIKSIQKAEGLKVDGIVGEKTYKVLKELDVEEHFKINPPSALNYVFTNKPIATEDNILLESISNGKGIEIRQVKLPINIVVLHYDAAMTSKTCSKILAKRNLGVDLVLDRDGKFYRAANSDYYYFYHAGQVNEHTIGIEISNPIELKYKDELEKIYNDVPIWREQFPHQYKITEYIGYSDAQINSLRKKLYLYQRSIKASRKVVIIDEDYLMIKKNNKYSFNKDRYLEMVNDKDTLYIIGHYHVALKDGIPQKVDPGFKLMQLMAS